MAWPTTVSRCHWGTLEQCYILVLSRIVSNFIWLLPVFNGPSWVPLAQWAGVRVGHLLLICFLLIGTLLLLPGPLSPLSILVLGVDCTAVLRLVFGFCYCCWAPAGVNILSTVAHFVSCCRIHTVEYTPLVIQLCHPIQINVQNGLLPIQKSIVRMQMVAHRAN